MELGVEVPACMFNELIEYLDKHTYISWCNLKLISSQFIRACKLKGLIVNEKITLFIFQNNDVFIASSTDTYNHVDTAEKKVGINEMFQKETYIDNGFEWKE